jgi:hypothetical protein
MSNIVEAKTYETDKSVEYLKQYSLFFTPFIEKEIKLLELGIHKGGSLILWKNYFPKSTIVGIDVNKIEITDERIHAFQGFQQDIKCLHDVALKMAPDGFDIIIDDASHIAEYTRISFWYLFENHLKKGGIYVIEDWGTGYWAPWPDGKKYKGRLDHSRNKSQIIAPIPHFQIRNIYFQLKNFLVKQIPFYRGKNNHWAGMVGFIKELIDECGMDDITNPNFGIPPYRSSKIEKMQISHGQVFIIKK